MNRNLWNIASVLSFVLFLAAFTPQQVCADERSHRQLAERFMSLTKVPEMMALVYEQLQDEQIAKLDVEYPGKTPEKDQILVRQVSDYFERKLVWNNFNKGYVEVYTEAFTEPELAEMVKFYSSPLGQKLLSTTRDIQIKLLQSTQFQLVDMIFDLKKIEADFVEKQSQNKK